MENSIKLSDLHLGDVEGFICVKILAMWVPKSQYFGKYCQMIVADVEEQRMEIKIPHPYYETNFEGKLSEDTWYLIYDFSVMVNPLPTGNTANPLIIKLTGKSRTKVVSMYRNPGCFKFHEIPKILNATCDSTFPEIDLYGIIMKVSKSKPLPYVHNAIEPKVKKTYREFHIVDDNGNGIKCCAMGEISEKFTKMWDEANYSIKYRGSQVFCILRFWKISGLEGERCLVSHDWCSRIMLDPSIEELGSLEYICRFTCGFYKENFEESEDELDWGVPFL